MATSRIKMPRLHRGQEEVRNSGARFRVLACGRRWGKSQLCAILALGCALMGGVVWWIGPTSREASIGWRKVAPVAVQIPGVKFLRSISEIQFPGGGIIKFLSAENHTLRGEGLDLVIVDEFAYLQRAKSVWQEDLRAALSDKLGNAVFISTPNGRDYFWDLYKRGQDPDWPEWASWQYSTYANPYVPDSEVDAAKDELPEWVFRQEYMAEFVAFAGRIYKSFDPAGPAVFRGKLEGYPEYFGGIDFGFRNPCAITVGGLKDVRLDIIDEVHLSGMTGEDLIDRVREFTERYKVRRWWADPADPGAINDLRLARLPVYPAPRPTGPERSSVKLGIVEVETRLVSGRLRFHGEHCPTCVDQFDQYRWADSREGAEVKEQPVKVNDHTCDSVRYMVVGLADYHRRTPRVRVAA